MAAKRAPAGVLLLEHNAHARSVTDGRIGSDEFGHFKCDSADNADR